MEYIDVCKIESHGNYPIGVRISLSLNRDVTEEEKKEISHLTDKLYRFVLCECQRVDPEEQKSREEEQNKLLACFEAPVYVERILNEYESEPFNQLRPWFRITTTRGPIKIGWRKRVIVLEWGECQNPVIKTAYDLFPHEDVTKGEYFIHAWGYDKAKAYVKAILTDTPIPKEELSCPSSP